MPRTGVLKNYNNNSDDNTLATKSVKKVSWNDEPTTTVLQPDDSEEEDEEQGEEEEPDEPEDGDVREEDRFSLQDIDDVLGCPQPNQSGGNKPQPDWLNNQYVSGNTPGVIGAQEVYNDPRQRIEAARLKSNPQATPEKVPEKLSFQEKMKMFAKSTGVQENDQKNNNSKMKTSKAQREIEERGGLPNGDE